MRLTGRCLADDAAVAPGAAHCAPCSVHGHQDGTTRVGLNVAPVGKVYLAAIHPYSSFICKFLTVKQVLFNLTPTIHVYLKQDVEDTKWLLIQCVFILKVYLCRLFVAPAKHGRWPEGFRQRDV